MYCTNCGTFNEDRAHYCKNCGEPLTPVEIKETSKALEIPVQEETPSQERVSGESPEKKKNRKLKFIPILAGILALLLLAALGYLFLSGGGKERSGEEDTAQEETDGEFSGETAETERQASEEAPDPDALYDEQLKQGNLCIEQLDYEGALSAFTEAIETAPERQEGYMGAADAYIRLQDYESALSILQNGLEQTGGDEHLADKLARVESGNIKDSSGNIRKRTRYDSSGNLIWFQIFTYNEDEKLVQAVSYDADGRPTATVEIPYDENGNPLKSVNYRSDTGEISTSDKTYDENGVLTQVRNYRAGTYFTLVYEYDSQGRISTIEEYDADNRLGQIMLYEYDGDSDLVSVMKGCDPDGSLLYYAEYEYDADGNRTLVNSYDADGTLNSSTKIIYDSNGERIGQEWYDSAGNLTASEAQ